METIASETDKISEGVENYDTVLQNILNANLDNQQILLKNQQAIIELITLVINKPQNKKTISKKL